MGKAKIALTLFFLSVALVVFAITYQQYDNYLTQRSRILQGDESNRRLNQEIEALLPEREAFAKRFSEVSQRRDYLRKALPSKMQLDKFKAGMEQEFKANKLKVLAQREARYSRRLYHEVRLIYSIKGSVTTVKRAYRQFNKQPRLMLRKGPEKESKETTGLQVSIFSVSPIEQPPLKTITCVGEPQGVWIPLLKDELTQLYSDYSRNCQALLKHSDLYHDMQRIKQLDEEVAYLKKVRRTIIENR